jgi:membrane fusion protein, multidrug efflux system
VSAPISDPSQEAPPELSVVASVAPPSGAVPKPRPKSKAKLVLSGLLLVAGLTGLTYWLFTRGKESTDDAQVEGHVLSVSARIPGQVVRVLVQDNQLVEKDAPIVELDRSELEAKAAAARADTLAAKATLDLAKAQLALTEKNVGATLRQARGGVSQAASGVTSTQAQIEQAKADLVAAEARLKLSRLELDRTRQLFVDGAVTQAEVDARDAAFDQAQATVDASRARLDATKAAASGGVAVVEQAEGKLAAAQTGPQQVEAARAQVELADARLKQSEAAQRLAELNLGYATILAPATGIVARRSVEVGHTVSPDRPLLAIVPLDDVWIVANFKESQIGAMRPGQLAEVQVDAYDGRKFRGHVDSIAGGTGARFALLPPDNASGNYVKVVQRVPVLIRLDDRGGLDFRPGMSADVTVRLR